MKIYNSLSRKVEEFKPINPPKVGMYTCGPTVYDYVTIGNWRTYIMADFFLRTLKYLGFSVDYIMNVTDVGHLTGDNEGDADLGVDRMEKGAKREGKTAWDIAKVYTKDFYAGYKLLNLIEPRKFTVATDHIPEQISLVSEIETKGYTYKTSDGIYFDTAKYEDEGYEYGALSNIDEMKKGARVTLNPEKKNLRDFALWKFSPKNEKRHMEWDSPWGKGFPGWHVECSAMSIKYLGKQFDIHTGGEDLRSTHHPNEIAQSESATGKMPFVKYWVHGAHLQVDGGRMGKSLGNAYNLHDLEKKGFDVLALRYFYLTGHYRKKLNFTWKSLEAAQSGYNKMKSQFASLKKAKSKQSTKSKKFKKKFNQALKNDLNTPQALAATWEVLKSDLSDSDKRILLLSFDKVLGLNLGKVSSPKIKIPNEINELAKERDKLREQKKFYEADRIRKEIEELGFVVLDKGSGTEIHQLK